MAPFIYAPLKDPKTEIRLFELAHGRGRLRGWLHHHELEAVSGSYDALSYCWGKQSKRVPIIVNKCTLSIGENLHAALKCIRRQQQGRLLMWIDALCINQDDTQEKNVQVPNMRNIYFHGRWTFVWLGRGDIWTALAFKEMKVRAAWERKHGKGRAEVGWWQWRRIHTDLQASNQWKDGDGIVTRLMAKVPFFGSLAQRSIFFRPWFSRCWVVQEIAASRAITMLCGKHHTDWSDLEMGFQAFSLEGYSEVCTLISVRQGFHTSENSSLETLLWRCSTFQTTDPRDRIFSLIGLVGPDAETVPNASHSSDSPAGIRVDYDGSIRDIYIEATLRCEVLFAWALPPLDSQVAKGGWTAAGASKGEPELDRQNGLLGLQGIIVDVVEFIGMERAIPPTTTQALRLRGLAKHVKTGAGNIKCYFQWRALAGVGTEEFYRGTTKTSEQAFLEIMCPMVPRQDVKDAVVVERHQQLSRQFDQFVTSNFSFMERRVHDGLRKRELVRIAARAAVALAGAGIKEKGSVEAAADFESKNTFSSGRRFLRTKQGYIGLGGPRVAVGDTVIIFAGSAAPFVARPSRLDRYQVVSDAYFVQMMDGELWDPSRCQTIWLE